MTEPGGQGPVGSGRDGPVGGDFPRHRRRRRRRPQGWQGEGFRRGGPESHRSPAPPVSTGAAPARQHLPALLLLVTALAGLCVAAVLIFRPFIAPITVALVVTLVSYPLFRQVQRLVGERHRGLASGLTCILLVLIVFVPVGWLVQSLVREVLEGVARKDVVVSAASPPTQPTSEGIKGALEAKIRQINAEIDKLLRDSPLQGYWDGFKTKERLDQAATQVGGWAASLLAGLLSDTVTIAFKFLIMLFTLFFFFKDGPQILLSVERSIPLEKAYVDRMVSTFSRVSLSVVRGTFGTALIQGLIATVAYAIVGVSAIFWGVVTTLSALVPGVGTSLVTVPMTGYFIYQALNAPEGGLGAWWRVAVLGSVAVGVGVLDNFVRPLLMREGLRVHSLWLLLSILGGVNLFGPMGLLYGPMVLVFLGTFVALLVQEEAARTTAGPSAAPATAGGPRPPGG